MNPFNRDKGPIHSMASLESRLSELESAIQFNTGCRLANEGQTGRLSKRVDNIKARLEAEVVELKAQLAVQQSATQCATDSNAAAIGAHTSDVNELHDRLAELEAAPVRRKLRNRLARLFQRLAAKLVVTR